MDTTGAKEWPPVWCKDTSEEKGWPPLSLREWPPHH